MLKCKKCGKELKDKRGARGHVQFTAGGGHGPKAEVPDDWRSYFEELDGAESDADDTPEGGESDTPEETEQEPNATASEEPESDGGIWDLLTTDLGDLLRGKS